MFIHSDWLFLIVFVFLMAVASALAYRHTLKETQKELWEEREKVRNLQEELIKMQNLHYEKLIKELKEQK